MSTIDFYQLGTNLNFCGDYLLLLSLICYNYMKFKGFAFWTCDPITQEFTPAQVRYYFVLISISKAANPFSKVHRFVYFQPDRTNCFSNWLDHVIKMVSGTFLQISFSNTIFSQTILHQVRRT